jgi:hypothetical protein
MGHDLSRQFGGGQFNGKRFSIGGGLSILSIFMGFNADRSKRKDIELYNEAQKSNKSIGFYEKPKISLRSNGLVVHF